MSNNVYSIFRPVFRFHSAIQYGNRNCRTEQRSRCFATDGIFLFVFLSLHMVGIFGLLDRIHSKLLAVLAINSAQGKKRDCKYLYPNLHMCNGVARSRYYRSRVNSGAQPCFCLTSLISRLISNAFALFVSSPRLMMLTPVEAYSEIFSDVMPPLASVRTFP